jgi:TolA-binding protein
VVKNPLLLTLVCVISFAVTAGARQSSKENADFKLAINLFNDGLYDLAVEQLKQFINSYPSTSQGIEARFYLGLTQLKLKHFDDARLTFQSFALSYQDNPKAPEAWWNVGESYAAVNNYREAALGFERVKVFHPKSRIAADALLQASTYFKLAGDRDNARRTLRTVMQEYPTSGAVLSARTQLGEIYFEEGNLDQAQNELKRVVEGDPSPDAKAQALLILANIYQATGRNDLAQTTYQEIITKYKSPSALQGAHCNLGKLQLADGKYLEAVDNFRKALATKGTTDSSLVRETAIGIGDAFAKLNDYTNALAAYNSFLAANASDERTPAVMWKVAALAAKAKLYKLSDDACAGILGSHADALLKRRAQLKRASNAAEQHNSAIAVRLYAAYTEEHPDDPSGDQALMQAAHLLENDLADPRKAAMYYEQLASRYPRSPLVDDAWFGMAQCFDRLKEYDQAIQSYQGLVRKFPASHHRTEAENRIITIETFEAKQKDAGLEKLALLLGDVVADRDKSGLAYRLGDVYFHDLKNYSAAVVQFTNAINSGIADQRFVDALFLRARAYEYLSWQDEKYRQPAIESYRTFLQSYPADKRSEDAQLSVFRLRSATLSAARTAYAEAIAARATPSLRREMALAIGKLLLEADSLREAISMFSSVIAAEPSSPAAAEARFQKMRAFEKLGVPDSVLAVGTEYLSKHPVAEHSAQVLATVARVFLASKTPVRAIELYKRLREDFWYARSATDVERQLADAYSAAGDHASASAEYAFLIDRDRNDPFKEDLLDPELMLAFSRAQLESGKSAEARKSLFALLANQPPNTIRAQAYNLLGMTYRAEGSLELATTYFKQAGSLSPGSIASKDIAGLLFDSGNYAEAIKQYALLVQNAGSDSERQEYDARIIIARLRSDDLVTAEKDMAAFAKKYRRSDEHSASFELERGSLFYRKQDYPGARKAFDNVLDKYGRSDAAPTAMYWIGKTLEATNKHQDALKQYTMIVQRYPASSIVPRTYLALGNIHYTVEKWDDAIKNYKRIVDDPKADAELLPYAMSNLIETYEAAGVFDAALTLTRKYLELYPNSEDAFDKRIKIGILYQRLGYNDQSILQLQTLLDEAGSDLEGEIRYYIAEANFNKGDYQQAILEYLKVPYLVTKKGKIDWTANSLYMAGQSYEKMSRYDQALTMYQQIVDRPGIDETFKAAARKEIDRVKAVLKRTSN